MMRTLAVTAAIRKGEQGRRCLLPDLVKESSALEDAETGSFKFFVVQVLYMMKNYNMNQTTLRILRLFADDYRGSHHLRAIARRVNVDVKAVQLQLRRLEESNVVSSVLVGRNKEYHLNLSNLITRYYMILAETSSSIDYLHRNFAIKRVLDEIGDRTEGILILFGSFAKEQVTRDSDVDIFLVSNTQLDREAIRRAGDLIDREINIDAATERDFKGGLEEHDPLIVEVVSNHIILKGVDGFCDIMWRFHARP